MSPNYLQIAALITICLNLSGEALAADRLPRSCSPHNVSFIKNSESFEDEMGGTGNQPTIPPGGMGGTGHDPVIPPGGMGGTGISTAGYIANIRGEVLALDKSKKLMKLAKGDAVCVGDTIASSAGMAKVLFEDGATLYVLKNTDVHIDDFYYTTKTPEKNRSQITLAHGDIRSVSGSISKTNPKDYKIQTPVATIRVIGTDFLVAHLLEDENEQEAGTYTKVSSGEVSVQSSSGTMHLQAGASSHVKLSGMQSLISGPGGGSSGTCPIPYP